MEETIVFLDEAFISKLSKYLGNGNYLRFDKINFVNNLLKKQNLTCNKIFYYICPPFHGNPPTKDEERRKEGFDKFIKKFSQNRDIIIREGRCQRIKIDNVFVYRQKYIDVYLAIDLMKVPLDYPNIKKVVLISSDSDFIPAINEVKKYGIKVILYTYYQKKRDADFSKSNELIKLVDKYIILSKSDFDNSPLIKTDKEDHKDSKWR